MYTAWAGLFAGLKTISTGGGYWNTFNSANVFGPLVKPDDQAELPATYLCIPFYDDEETFSDQQRGAMAEWVQTSFAFVRDTKYSDSETATIEKVAKVRDDLVRYVLKNPTLGGTVDEVVFVAGGRTAGHGRDHRYGEYQLYLRMRQYLDENTLG